MNDPSSHLPSLSPQDARLFDALVECGFDLDALALTDDDRRRAQTLIRLFDLLHDYPVEDADPALIDATLARIDRHERHTAGAETRQGRWTFRVRMPDFVTLAAVVLIGASVLFPIMSGLRKESIKAACENNVRMLGWAFDAYAADNGSALPTAEAGLASTWSHHVRNVLNLNPLLEGGYCELGHLSCPGHRGQAGESYSYQWQPAGARIHWHTSPKSIILGDRNPVIDAMADGGPLMVNAASTNHPGRGQSVLSTDGEVFWLKEPVIGRGDNIWTPEGGLRDGISGIRLGDVFLAN